MLHFVLLLHTVAYGNLPRGARANPQDLQILRNLNQYKITQNSLSQKYKYEPKEEGTEVTSQEEVKEMYAKAIELGAQDEGEPGMRGGTFYGAYVRDLDGNKLVFFHFG